MSLRSRRSKPTRDRFRTLVPPNSEFWVTRSIAPLLNSGLGNRTPEQYRAQIAQLQQQATQLEADLNNRSAEFRSETQPITLEAVQAQIPTDTTLVELVQYRPFDPKAKRGEGWGNPRYAAYLLTPNGTIQAIDLGEAASIDQLADDFRHALRDRESSVKPIARKLDAVLMQPIRQKLGNTRNHSYYQRTLADMPCVNFKLTLTVQASKFFCDTPGCIRRIFTERIPEIAAPWARKTVRLVQRLEAIGLTLGGAAGARLSHQVGTGVCSSTLLNVLEKLPLPEFEVPKILGVDISKNQKLQGECLTMNWN